MLTNKRWEVRTIKVAVISDIHGNIVALEAIIKQLKKETIDAIIVLGDLCNELPFGDAVIHRLMELNAYCIKGNKEEYFLEYERRHYEWDNLQFKNTIFMYHALSEDSKEYIRNLPFDLNLTLEGATIKAVHGSPSSLYELVHQYDEEKLEKYTKNLKEDILLLGHTHDPIWTIQKNGKTVINAGCSGVSVFHIGQAEYLILNIHHGKFQIEKKMAKFSLETLKKKLLASGMVENEKTFINLVYLALIGKKEIRKNFYDTGKRMMEQKGKKLYREDAEGIFKTFKLFDDDVWRKLTATVEPYFLLKGKEK